uniref:RWD domain-containing protein 2B n=1 Tax=Schistocephalus solidus TaxID=70667 RepID=A0A0X3PXP8_SCHSO
MDGSQIAAKLAEINLLRSIFTDEELKFSHPDIVEQIDCLTSAGLPVEDCDIDFSLKLKNAEPPVSAVLSVTLPVGYPSVSTPPLVVLRLEQPANSVLIDDRRLCSKFYAWLSQESMSGEPVICAAADWIRSALCKVTTQPSKLPTELPTPASNRNSGEEVRLWILSHHIRNPKKRRVIVEWARELNLQGCCLPGKPGIVVVEGDGNNADEYWRRIRVLTWKRIQVKEREGIGGMRHFTDGFFEVGGTLSEKLGYLSDHGISRQKISSILGFKAD